MEPPPLLRDPGARDADHLRILAILHYVFAGLGVLALGLLAAHWAFLRFMLGRPDLWKDAHGSPPAELLAMFHWFYVVGAIFFIGGMALNAASARCLQRRRARAFSLVVAGLDCLVSPIGPVLAAFTVVVLLRPSVIVLYAGDSARGTESPPAESAVDGQLRLLVVCHSIKGGLSLLNVAILAVQAALLPGFLAADPAAPAFVLPIFRILLFVLGGFSLTLGLLNLLSARALARRRHRRLSQVVAGLNLVSIPVGTALGVYTLVVLSRADVKQAYRLAAPPRPGANHA